MRISYLVAVMLSAACLTSVYASGPDGRIAHFKGKPAPSLEVALINFNEYNHKLQVILSGPLSNVDMAEVDRITYTLENALKKINSEMTGLAVTLERVHQASEKLDRKAVLDQGRRYLSVSGQVIK